MKKKKYPYILLIIIMLFSLNTEVKADLVEEAGSHTCEELKKNGTLKKDKENLLISNASKYETNCIYIKTEKDKNGEKKCLIMQIAFNKDGSNKIQSISIYDPNEKIPGETRKIEYIGSNEKEVNEQYFRDRAGSCPVVGYERTEKSKNSMMGGLTITEKFTFGGSKNQMEKLLDRSVEFEVPSLIIGAKKEIKSCADVLGNKGVNLLKTIKTIIMTIVPIILIVLGSIDLIKAVFSADENNMKKAQGTLIKRIIIAVIIFLVPTILHLTLQLANQVWPEIDSTMCGIYEK